LLHPRAYNYPSSGTFQVTFFFFTSLKLFINGVLQKDMLSLDGIPNFFYFDVPKNI